MDGTQLSDYLGPASTFAERFWPSPQNVEKAVDTLNQGGALTTSFFNSEVGLAVTVLGSLLAVMILMLFWPRKEARKSKGEDMRHWERERQLKEKLGDRFTDVVEDLFVKKQISKGDRAEIYKRLEAVFHSDQFRHQRHPARLKAQIKARKGDNTPVNIPGDAPPPITKNELPPAPKAGKRRFGMISSFIAANKSA